MKIYLADLNYSTPQITEYDVEEKGKNYKVISCRAIIGWDIWARSIKKDDERICKSVRDAILYLETQAKELADARKEEYESALKQYIDIHDISDVIRKDPAKLDSALAELRK